MFIKAWCFINVLSIALALGEQASPSLKDIMIFLTSCESVPPLGFSMNPTIDFTDEEQFPVSSTCSLTLTFSRKTKTSFTDFKEIMDLTVLGSEGFSRA